MADWLKNSRQERLDLSRQWLKVFAESSEGSRTTNAEAWAIPDTVVKELEELADKAEAALELAKNENTRTPVANKACATAFDALGTHQRLIKKRYLFIPPLSAANMTALGLNVPDTTRTETGEPTAQVAVRVFPSGGFNEIGILLEFIKGDNKDPANKEYRVYSKVVASGEKPPVSPEELSDSFSTKRLRDVVRFDFGSSGKTVYFAVRAENKKKKGPWGPLSSAVIP